MKTKGLTFLEAVEALRNGRCNRIMAVANGCTYKLNYAGEVRYINLEGDYGPTHLTVSVLLGCWNLVDPKPQTEERTLEYWLIVWKHGAISTSVYQPSIRVYEQAQHIIPKTHTYTYTFPEDD